MKVEGAVIGAALVGPMSAMVLAGSRVTKAIVADLPTVKTLANFDFSFQLRLATEVEPLLNRSLGRRKVELRIVDPAQHTGA